MNINGYSPCAMLSSFCGYATEQYNKAQEAVESILSSAFACCCFGEKTSRPIGNRMTLLPKQSEPSYYQKITGTLSSFFEKISEYLPWIKSENDSIDLDVDVKKRSVLQNIDLDDEVI